MNQEIESSADSKCCADGNDSGDLYEADSSDTQQQQQQRNGIVECQIQPLGSNNYKDSQSYLYTKNNSRKSNLYLRCKHNIKHHCPARVTVRDNNFQGAVMTIRHNHPPEKKILDRQIFDKKLEENIDRDPFQTPRQVYLATKSDLLNIIDTTHIPSLKKLEGIIYRHQRKYIPKLPSTIEEFIKSVADERYRDFFTKDQRNLSFYRGCWMSSKGERNLVFISETTLKLVNTMNHISLFMDGTYKALPHHILFRQLYVISVTYENQCYPLAYIFMEKKTFSSYDCIFQNLKFLMPSVEVAKVMTDYEAATRKALKKHYPNARIAGCFFHYVQAIVKRTKSFGLRKDERFTEAVKKLCYLALLPNEFVLEGFECIDNSVSNFGSTRWERFRKYWMKQWAPANISVYGLGDRTNNFSESNNKSLNLFLLKHHPNIWNLIKNLKLLEMDKSDKITRAKLGEIFELNKSNDSLAFDKKLKLATELFEEEQDVGRFLDRVAYGTNVELFVKDQVNIMDDFSDVDVEDETDDEVLPNDYNRESDFRKSHPRQAAGCSTK